MKSPLATVFLGATAERVARIIDITPYGYLVKPNNEDEKIESYSLGIPPSEFCICLVEANFRYSEQGRKYIYNGIEASPNFDIADIGEVLNEVDLNLIDIADEMFGDQSKGFFKDELEPLWNKLYIDDPYRLFYFAEQFSSKEDSDALEVIRKMNLKNIIKLFITGTLLVKKYGSEKELQASLAKIIYNNNDKIFGSRPRGEDESKFYYNFNSQMAIIIDGLNVPLDRLSGYVEEFLSNKNLENPPEYLLEKNSRANIYNITDDDLTLSVSEKLSSLNVIIDDWNSWYNSEICWDESNNADGKFQNSLMRFQVVDSLMNHIKNDIENAIKEYYDRGLNFDKEVFADFKHGFIRQKMLLETASKYAKESNTLNDSRVSLVDSSLDFNWKGYNFDYS